MGALRRGIRNAFRNPARTVAVVLVLSVALALAIAMFVARSAADERVKTATSNFGTTIEVSPAGSFGGFGATGNPLTDAQLSEIAGVPHVTSVASVITQRLSGAGSSNNTGGFNFTDGSTSLTSPLTYGSLGSRGSHGGFGGGFGPSPDTPLPINVTGTNAVSASVLRATSFTLTSGATIPATGDADVADVGSTLASKNDLTVGSTFTAYGTTIKVVGIYTTGSPDGNAGFILPLKTEEALSGVTGATAADVTVDSLANVASTASAIQSTLGASNVNVISSQSNTSTLASDLNSIKTVSLFSLVGAIIAAAAILLLTMMLIVRERRREIGILKAFGSSNRGVVGSFVAESLTLTLVAGVIGIGLGILLSNPVLNALKPSNGNGGFGGFGGRSGGFGGFGGRGGFLGTGGLSQLHAVFSGNVVVYAVLAILGVALVGSGLPAYFTSKVRPAEALRSE